MILRRSRVLVVVALVAAIVAVVSAFALASGNSVNTAGQIQAHPGPEGFLAAHDVSTSEANPVFTLRDGQTVSTADNGDARCLLHGIGKAVTGNCFSDSEVAAGQAVKVADECGTNGRNLMEITGLAPDGITGARLTRSDGTSEETTIADGAFKFEGTNPTEGQPYPTTVEWISSDGGSTGTANLPVEAGQFCLPTNG